MKVCTMLLCLAAPLGLSSCYMATLPPGPGFRPPGPLYPPPGHSHAPPHWHDDSSGGVRQAGYDFGRSDRYAGLDSRPDRHRNRVSSKHWNTFVAGYRDGYASVHLGHPPRPIQPVYNDAVWRSGVSLGQLDRRRGLSSDYRRYRSRYTARTEASFREGYQHGWHGR
jgi:hypothetical protein